MISQFNQPRGSTSIEVNKQSIARNFGVKEDEVIYFTAGIDLSGFKVIYDESTQRAYSLPFGIVSGTTAISLDERAILTHSAGSVDLGELAVSREEYVTLPGSFNFGHTINVKNELLVHDDKKYRWDGSLPKVVAAGSTPDSSGGVGLGAWLSVGDAALRAELNTKVSDGTFPATIKYKYGLPSVIDGAIYRTVQDKLDDFVFLEDFGGKDDAGSTDNSIAFRKAFASGARKIRLRGSGVYGMATRDIELPAKYEIIGNAKNPEIKYLGTDTSFTMFTLTGSGPASNQWKQGGMFRDLIISSDVKINWMLGRHVQNLDYDRVFFYNSATVLNNYHYVNFTRCERWGSAFIGRADLNTIQFISESPKFHLCFSSGSPIDVWDTADLAITKCTMFAGDYAVRTRVTQKQVTAPDLFAGYPVLITCSVFDAVRGHAWDLEGSVYSTITGNLVSAGRDTNSHGAYIKGGRSLSLTGNVFTYCGNYGLVLEDVQQSGFVGNVFNGNKTGGLGTLACKDLSIVGGSMGTTYVRGGYYTQPVGYSDISSNSTGILLSGVAFDEALTTKVYLDTSITTRNKVINCSGVPDTIARGSTANRPANPQASYQYYDTTLGIPIWWNSVSGTWKNAAGADVHHHHHH
uniref:Tailspike protein n=1 Tax=Kuttervirus CBA120 TaxID=1987159 RepID=UPI00110D251B|nr:Chain A, Tailspike protein [Kuttervirus CBA120]6NW9_B Chain B, Tailspike protein [Kuttervirus CBA120]6NW9_C Chain C, Tailspike protein [Kuttervirus CBA120]